MLRRIYVSTACLQGKTDLSSRIRAYENSGLYNIELGAGVYNCNNIRKYDLNKFKFLVHNYFPPPPVPFVINLASSDEVVRNKSILFIKESMKFSKRVNAPFYSVHAGFINDPIGYKNNQFVFPEKFSIVKAKISYELFLNAIRELSVIAANMDTKLLIENNVCTESSKGKLLLQTHEEFEEFFKEIRSNQVGILLDTGHLNITAKTFSFEPTTAIEKIKPYICALHIHENDGISDTHEPLRAEGWIYELLKKRIFNNIPIVIEAKFGDIDSLKKHIGWIEAVLEQNKNHKQIAYKGV